jgi:hypothetical protein
VKLTEIVSRAQKTLRANVQNVDDSKQNFYKLLVSRSLQVYQIYVFPSIPLFSHATSFINFI